MGNDLSNRLQQALTVFVYACQSQFVYILALRGASSKGHRADELEKRQLWGYPEATWVLSPQITDVCHCAWWLQAHWLSNILHTKRWMAKASVLWDSGQEHWVRAEIEKKALGSNPPCRAMHGGMAQPIENRAAQHYSGQPSSSQRATETDAYASARHDYDAAQCPAIFTGLPLSKLDTSSLTAACQFTFTREMCVCAPCLIL